jgi:hypothetical protein
MNIKSIMEKSEMKVGLTFNQILALLSVIAAVFMAWLQINVRVAQAETRIDALEFGLKETTDVIETNRIENRDDHKAIMQKLDKLIEQRE